MLLLFIYSDVHNVSVWNFIYLVMSIDKFKLVVLIIVLCYVLSDLKYLN